MSKPVLKPQPRAAAPKPAVKPVAKKTLGQRVLAALGLDDDDEPTAALETTELDNGAMLYHDGALAVDTAVFNDEAMTEATADGDYDAADGSMISVTSGLVTAITEASAEEESEAPAASADLLKRIEALEKGREADASTIKTLTADLSKFKSTVPPAPTTKARATAKPQVDPKASGKAGPAKSSPFA